MNSENNAPRPYATLKLACCSGQVIQVEFLVKNVLCLALSAADRLERLQFALLLLLHKFAKYPQAPKRMAWKKPVVNSIEQQNF